MGETEEELPGFAVGALGVGRGMGFEPEVEGGGPFLRLGDLLLLRKGGADAGLQPDIRPGGIPESAPSYLGMRYQRDAPFRNTSRRDRDAA